VERKNISERLNKLEQGVADERSKLTKAGVKVGGKSKRPMSAAFGYKSVAIDANGHREMLKKKGETGLDSDRGHVTVLDQNNMLDWKHKMYGFYDTKRPREGFHHRFAGPILSGPLSVASWQPGNVHRGANTSYLKQYAKRPSGATQDFKHQAKSPGEFSFPARET